MRVAEMQLFFSFLTLKFGKVGGGLLYLWIITHKNLIS